MGRRARHKGVCAHDELVKALDLLLVGDGALADAQQPRVLLGSIAEAAPDGLVARGGLAELADRRGRPEHALLVNDTRVGHGDCGGFNRTWPMIRADTAAPPFCASAFEALWNRQ